MSSQAVRRRATPASELNEAFRSSRRRRPVVHRGGSDPRTTDSDSDGFTNQDEVDNDTDPCSTASVPPDADGDHLSDLNDPDDDNDTVRGRRGPVPTRPDERHDDGSALAPGVEPR